MTIYRVAWVDANVPHKHDHDTEREAEVHAFSLARKGIQSHIYPIEVTE